MSPSDPPPAAVVPPLKINLSVGSLHSLRTPDDLSAFLTAVEKAIAVLPRKPAPPSKPSPEVKLTFEHYRFPADDFTVAMLYGAGFMQGVETHLKYTGLHGTALRYFRSKPAFRPHERGGYTLCRLRHPGQEEVIGVASCSPYDNFSYAKGRVIAFGRAAALWHATNGEALEPVPSRRIAFEKPLPLRHFYDTNRAWYFTERMADEAKWKHEIMIGDPHGEFAVRWYDLGPARVPRIEAFGDGWKTFHACPDLLDKLNQFDNVFLTPEQFIAEILKPLGFYDKTEYERR